MARKRLSRPPRYHAHNSHLRLGFDTVGVSRTIAPKTTPKSELLCADTRRRNHDRSSTRARPKGLILIVLHAFRTAVHMHISQLLDANEEEDFGDFDDEEEQVAAENKSSIDVTADEDGDGVADFDQDGEVHAIAEGP